MELITNIIYLWLNVMKDIIFIYYSLITKCKNNYLTIWLLVDYINIKQDKKIVQFVNFDYNSIAINDDMGQLYNLTNCKS